MCCWQLEGPFDYILCVGVLHHLANPQAGLNLMARMLEPTAGVLSLMVLLAPAEPIVMMSPTSHRAPSIAVTVNALDAQPLVPWALSMHWCVGVR